MVKRFSLSAIISFTVVFGGFLAFNDDLIAEAGFDAPNLASFIGDQVEKTVSLLKEPSVQGTSFEDRKPASDEEMHVVLRKTEEQKVAMNEKKPDSSVVKGLVEISKQPVVETTNKKRQAYDIQVASNPNRDTAESILMQLQSKGYKGFIVSAKVNDKEYFRVKVGPYPNKEVAMAEKEKLTTSTEFKDAILANHSE